MHILKQLRTKKGRDESGLFIVEGEKLVAEIPDAYHVTRYIFSQSYADAHQTELAHYKKTAPAEVLRDSLFNTYAPAQAPQGIAAICKQVKYDFNRFNDSAKNNPFLLICEELQDPGNVGTLIRTAAAAGAGGVILTQGSADLYNPKVLRSAAGAALCIPVVTDVPVTQALARLKSQALPLYAAHPRGTVLPYELNMKKGFCLLIGNEAHGLSDEAATQADALVYLPMINKTESLNASAAGSILLYEAVRQRRGG
jgi:TrmH family RNA methyltransferase